MSRGLSSVKRVSYPVLSVVSREISLYPILFVSVKTDPYALLSVSVKRDPYTLLSVNVKITPSPLPMMDEGLASKSSGLIYQLNPSPLLPLFLQSRVKSLFPMFSGFSMSASDPNIFKKLYKYFHNKKYFFIVC
jgi:hypothetical protein